MKSLLISGLLMMFLISCGSSDKKEIKEVNYSETIKKDYIVRDSSSGNLRPAWIYQPLEWAKTKRASELKDNRYFSFETEPKVKRNIACNLARANVKVDIAGEITTFISKTLGSSQEGNADIDENNPEVQGLRSFVENTLAEKIQAVITGAAVVKTYWEKRAYKKDLGAKRDYIGYTCAVLVKMKKERLNRAIDRAASILDKKADDPKTKENVKNAIKEAKENFSKLMDSTVRG